MSNYPDDYRPWLPGGPEHEPWKGRMCRECLYCIELYGEDGRKLPVMACLDDLQHPDSAQLVMPDEPACENYEG